MMSKLLLDVARPFLRRSPRYTGFLYRMLGGVEERREWDRWGWRLIRGAEHGYQMVLNLGNGWQRNAYYHGQFHDLAAQRLIKRFLNPGDTFIDVGANIGMLTLCAARVVGPEGTIAAFEPNPQARSHLEMHVQMNRLSQVRVHGCPLSLTREDCTLIMPTESSSKSTLLSSDDAPTKSYQVRTALLDDFLEDLPPGRRTLLKIDTEGFEFNVLQGACELLTRPEVFILVEVTDAWLRRLGQSAEMLFRFLEERGYQVFHPYMQPRRWHQNLVIDPLSLPGPHHNQFDAFFVPGGMTNLGIPHYTETK